MAANEGGEGALEAAGPFVLGAAAAAQPADAGVAGAECAPAAAAAATTATASAFSHTPTLPVIGDGVTPATVPVTSEGGLGTGHASAAPAPGAPADECSAAAVELETARRALAALSMVGNTLPPLPRTLRVFTAQHAANNPCEDSLFVGASAAFSPCVEFSSSSS